MSKVLLSDSNYNCATLCGFKIFFGSNTLLIPFINSRFSVGRDSLRYGFLAKPLSFYAPYIFLFSRSSRISLISIKWRFNAS